MKLRGNKWDYNELYEKSIDKKNNISGNNNRYRNLNDKYNQLSDEYWVIAQKHLVSTKALSVMPDVMEPYYHINEKEKLAATKLLQRVVRKYLNKLWKYKREFYKSDENVASEIYELNTKKRNLQLQSDNPSLCKSVFHRNNNFHIRAKELKDKMIAAAHLNKGNNANNNINVITTPTIVITKNFEVITLDSPLRSSNKTPRSSRVDLNTSKSQQTPISSTAVNSSPRRTIIEGNLSTRERPMSSTSQHRRTSAIHEIFHNDDNKPVHIRPKTANSIKSEYNEQSLMKSRNNKFGLPIDVFENQQHDVSLAIGMKFLRTMSSNPKIYDGIQVVKKNKKNSNKNNNDSYSKTFTF